MPIFEVGVHEGQHYFSMGFVDGLSLADKLSEGPLSPKEAAELTRQLAEAIGYAHEQGVIHRDLKPANVLLAQRPESSAEAPGPRKQRDASGFRGSSLSTLDSRPRITDFGLAKKMEGDSNLTGTGQILGTPSYMPPEQAAGKTDEIDPTADVYSLGAVLYTTLTGRPPFQAANPMDTLLQVLDRDAVPPRQLDVGIPRDLETICLKCLEKDSQHRYLSANELAAKLRRFLNDEPIRARPLGATSRAWRWCRRNPIVATLSSALTAILLMLAVVGPIIALKQTKLANDNRELAVEQTKLAGVNKELANKERDARSEAEKKSVQLEEQLRTSTALRLAAQSQIIRHDAPIRSLLLGIEAIEATHRHDGSILPVAHQAVQDRLSEIGGRPLVGHSGAVKRVTVSPNGRWVVTASEDQTARVWDLVSQAPAIVLPNDSRVASVVVSPDSRWLVTKTTENTARLWDLTLDDSAASPYVLGQGTKVSTVAFGPNSRWFTFGNLDKTARLWDLTHANPAASAATLKHPDAVWSGAISPDGHWLATGSVGKTVRLWDLRAKDPAAAPVILREVPGRLPRVDWQGVQSVAFSPDSRWLVVVGQSDSFARMWDLTGDLEASPFVLCGHSRPATSLVISPDSRWVVTTSRDDESSLGWDLSAVEFSQQDTVVSALTASAFWQHKGWAESVAISPDSRWLVIESDDKTARIFDLTTPKPAASAVLRGHAGTVDSTAFSRDSRWLVTASTDKTARLWDLASADPAASTKVLSHQTTDSRRRRTWPSIAISRDSRRLVTGSGDKTARVWDLTAEDPATEPIATKTSKVPNEVGDTGLELSPNSRGKSKDTETAVTLAVTSEAISDDLRAVIEAWPTLDQVTRREILSMIQGRYHRPHQ